MTNRISWRSAIDAFTTIAILGATAAIVHSLYFNKKPGRVEVPLPKEVVDVSGAEVLGNRDAQIGIVVITDFQCPFCAEFAKNTLPVIEESHVRTGRVFVALRHLPLTQLHPFAAKAAAIAECSRSQGRFREVHDTFFREQERIGEDSLSRLAGEAGVPLESIAECVKSTGRALVQKDVDWARSLKVSSTPTLFIGQRENGRALRIKRAVRGAISAEQLSTMIEEVARPQSTIWTHPMTLVGLIAVGGAAAFAFARPRWRLASKRDQSSVHPHEGH